MQVASKQPPEPTTFEDTYQKYVRLIWRLVRRLGVPESETYDVTHKVFIIAHRKWSDFDGTHPMSWLIKIAERQAADWRNLARVRYEATELSDSTPTTDLAPDERVAQRQILDKILEQLGELRLIFVLHEVEGFTLREIADVVDAPISTVHGRLKKAVAQAKLHGRQLLGRGS